MVEGVEEVGGAGGARKGGRGRGGGGVCGVGGRNRAVQALPAAEFDVWWPGELRAAVLMGLIHYPCLFAWLHYIPV